MSDWRFGDEFERCGPPGGGWIFRSTGLPPTVFGKGLTVLIAEGVTVLDCGEVALDRLEDNPLAPGLRTAVGLICVKGLAVALAFMYMCINCWKSNGLSGADCDMSLKPIELPGCSMVIAEGDG